MSLRPEKDAYEVLFFDGVAARHIGECSSFEPVAGALGRVTIEDLEGLAGQ
jgi:hypothetical protein